MTKIARCFYYNQHQGPNPSTATPAVQAFANYELVGSLAASSDVPLTGRGKFSRSSRRKAGAQKRGCQASQWVSALTKQARNTGVENLSLLACRTSPKQKSPTAQYKNASNSSKQKNIQQVVKLQETHSRACSASGSGGRRPCQNGPNPPNQILAALPSPAQGKQ